MSPAKPTKPVQPETIVTSAGRDPDRQEGAVNPAVSRMSTVIFPTLDAFERRAERKYTTGFYGTHGTSTTRALADALTELSGGHRAIVTSSGLSAITQAVLAFVRQGDHVLIADSVYGPTRIFCSSVLGRFGVDVTYYDPLAGEAEIAALLRPATRIVYTESPGSLTFEVQDIPGIARAAQAHGALVIMDNTWATPLNFRAFDHRVDLEVQAGTKYIGGHSDLLLGVITVRTEEQYRRLRDGVGELGDVAAPDVCYEALRGLRTMSVRLRYQACSALEIAEWLARRPEVARVLHPALPADPGHALWKRDFRGASSLFGVLLRTGDRAAVAAMLDGMRVFRIGASFGGYESLIIPALPHQSRTVRPWRETAYLLRLHVGLEATSDLIADLEAGFARLGATLAIAADAR